jgi:hypothetical protein
MKYIYQIEVLGAKPGRSHYGGEWHYWCTLGELESDESAKGALLKERELHDGTTLRLVKMPIGKWEVVE